MMSQVQDLAAHSARRVATLNRKKVTSGSGLSCEVAYTGAATLRLQGPVAAVQPVPGHATHRSSSTGLSILNLYETVVQLR